MKFLICFLAVMSLLASTHAWNKIEHTNGKELLHVLEGGYYQDGGLHRIYVITFYNPGVGSENLQAKNNEYRQAIKTQVLDRWNNVYYTEVDATSADYVKFSEDVIGVNTAELIHAPSILIMENGQGVWIHGPEAVSRIARYVPTYEERARISRH